MWSKRLNHMASFVVLMDELDLAILRELQRDGRASITDIARAIGKPRTTVANRLERLMEEGVIKGFKPILDFKKLGYNITAFVLLKVRRTRPIAGKSNQLVLVEKLIEKGRFDGVWVEEAHIITGQYDILLKLRAREIDALTKFLIVHLASFADVVHTETCMALITVGEGRPLPL